MPTRPGAATARLAWLYPLAWLPYLALYGLALGYGLRLEPQLALVAALANALPPALLGLGVLALCARLAWEPRRRARFFLLHAAGAALYAALSVAGATAIFRVFERATGRAGRPFDPRVAFWQVFIATLLYSALASLAYAAALVVRLRDEEARRTRLAELRTRAELKALRARLDPHFLFNTLHSLLALVRREPRAAEEAIERLGDLLHYVLRGQEGGGEVLLEEELAFVRDYLEIEKLRLGERLQVEEEVEAAARRCRIPAFSLQPLVENAVRHGVAARAEGGRLAIGAAIADGELRLTVADDGPGAAPARIGDSGHGLALVREQLRAAHGERSALEIETAPGQGFLARLRLPALPAAPPEEAE